jgi:hypothetical protein
LAANGLDVSWNRHRQPFSALRRCHLANAVSREAGVSAVSCS